MTKIEVKRFFRKKNEYTSLKTTENAMSTDSTTDQVPSTSRDTLCFGGIEFQRPKNTRPWEQSKYGWIPRPTSERSHFMNNLLPKFYVSYHRKSKNNREFVKLFHCEGRRQYECSQHIKVLNSRVDAIFNHQNPGAAGKFYDDNYVLIPSDQMIIRSNIEKLLKVKNEIEEEDKNVKEHLSTLYTKSGKLKDGMAVYRDFNEENITVLSVLSKIVLEKLDFLHNVETKCKDMFRGHVMKFKSKKKSKMDNKRKAQKRKADREAENFDLIAKRLSDGTTPVQDIDVDALLSLKGNQLYWLRKMMEKKSFFRWCMHGYKKELAISL